MCVCESCEWCCDSVRAEVWSGQTEVSVTLITFGQWGTLGPELFEITSPLHT